MTMLGHGISPCISRLADAAPVDPTRAYALSFIGATFPAAVTFSRASTATAIDTATGVMNSFAVDAPRFGAAYGGYIREGQRTNTMFQSGAFTDANCVVTTGQADPAGGTTARLVTATASTGRAATYPSRAANNVTGGSVYTLSAFVKPGTSNRVQVLSSVGFTTNYANFLLSGSGSVSQSTDSNCGIIAYANGWYRVWMTVTAAGTGSYGVDVILISTGTETRNPSITYSGTETYTVCFWQLELGSTPSSYIPTTTASVTRSADVSNDTNSPTWFNDAEGTFVVKGTTAYYNDNLASSPRLMVIDDGTVNEKHDLFADKATGTFRGSTVDGGVSQGSVSGGAMAQVTAFKAAYAYKLNDMASCLNGGTVGTDGTGTMPTGMTRVQVAGISGAEFGGPIASIDYYNVRKSNATLQELTT
jgi:hypothetical protein